MNNLNNNVFGIISRSDIRMLMSDENTTSEENINAIDEEIGYDEDGGDGGYKSVWPKVGLYISAIALFCLLCALISNAFDLGGGSKYHLGSGRAKTLTVIFDIFASLPDCIPDSALALGMIIIFFSLKKYLDYKGLKDISRGAVVMLNCLCWTSVALLLFSVLEYTESEVVSTFWSVVDVMIAIECVVLGIILAKYHVGVMAAWMIVYGIYISLVYVFVLVYSSMVYFVNPWVITIVIGAEYAIAYKMLKSTADYIGD